MGGAPELARPVCPRCYRQSPMVLGKSWCAWCLDVPGPDLMLTQKRNLMDRESILELIKIETEDSREYRDRERLEDE